MIDDVPPEVHNPGVGGQRHTNNVPNNSGNSVPNNAEHSAGKRDSNLGTDTDSNHDDAPGTESPAAHRSRSAFIHRVRPFVVGAGAGCLVLFLALEAVGFLSYGKLLAGVVLIGLVATTRHGQRLMKLGLAAAALLSALIVFTPLMDWSVHTLDVSVAPRQADVIVVLGAGIQCGSGNLDATSVARTTKGLALWKDGLAPRITVSDGDRSILGTCPSQGQVTVDFITSLLGDDGPQVVVLPRMRTTRTEADAIADLQETEGWKTVMVVTSPTHTRRAIATFRKAGVENAFVVAADETNFDTAFGHPMDRVRALGPVFRELAGMIKNGIRP